MDLQPLACAYDEDNNTLVVSGSVDELSGVVLREKIVQYSDEYRRDLVVDLGGVDLLPSLGVGVLAVAQRNAETLGAKIELVCASGTVVHQVLNVCGLPYRER
ncbi:STAS domain-containing protein [Nocardioides sp. zg-536]|uniref:STAS domain-containing protein n=1 Tax=Nocardioides faecalis TaxID=2803858 RepID=A0A939BXC5_9ACTN|nr:STAS domain-containing protein [Nocardioides faecalis]MBM9461577.1 STAS domain-containing protein [Nocardioides faecalis]MBS4752513.1 STAS domain-containing protein [Nocardioides faecalis]QVI57789.1 STAS domain-containing protein [Nocardioides faecalis]